MFGSLGGPELIVIFIVGLVVFGPRKLPEIGKSLGRMIGEFKRASADFQRTVEDEVETEKLRKEVSSAEYGGGAALPEPAPEQPALVVREAEGSIPVSVPSPVSDPSPGSVQTTSGADISGDTFSGEGPESVKP